MGFPIKALVGLALSFNTAVAATGQPASSALCVPILLYHRFDPSTPGAMTVTTKVFASHLQYLKQNGYTVIRLHDLVGFLTGQAAAPPPRSVVIAADDGHQSVYHEMFPLVKQFQVPVTLFIYPSAVSKASYALTWGELRELSASGWFDVESHTYWHPNFKNERRRLEGGAYQRFLEFQLSQSKQVLERRLGCRVDLLAWPFGIYDPELIEFARRTGYIAGFTLERRPVRESDPIMALPRFLMEDSVHGRAFERFLKDAMGEIP